MIATPHASHAELAVRTLAAGKACVVDKVMALTTVEADRMIEARDISGRMLSVFHNRRWDWDFLTLQSVLAGGRIGRPLVLESSVCRYAPPRTWRGRVSEAGTILHDWGAHLVDQALLLGLGPCRRVSGWLTPAPWEGVDSGGHGRIVMEFDDAFFQVETSRISASNGPAGGSSGSDGAFVKSASIPRSRPSATATSTPPPSRPNTRDASGSTGMGRSSTSRCRPCGEAGTPIMPTSPTTSSTTPRSP